MKKIIFAILVAVLANAAYATDVPSTLSFTARLVDDKSDAALTGTHSVVFSMFDAETAGHQVWTETHQVDVATDGLVFVTLGDTTALDGHVFDGTDRWVEISVDGTTMDPRIVIDSVPYAVRSTAASNADAVGGKTADQFQMKLSGSCNNGQHIQNIGGDGTIVCASDSTSTGDITAVIATNGLVGGAQSGDATLGLMSCAANQILKFTGGGWTCATDDTGITGVVAGSGLMGGGTSGSVTVSMINTCGVGQMLKWTGTGWGCANDIDTNSGGTISSATAGGGLVVSGSSIGMAMSCASGQLLKWNGTAWACANDIDTDTNSGGTITSVIAGNGLTGGATTGAATLNVGAGTGIVVAADTVSLDTSVTDARYLMLTGGTMTGTINMNNNRVTNRGCATGYVVVGPGLCTESVDTSGMTFAGAANRCRAAGTHLCTSAETRAIIASAAPIGDNMLLDWIDDQDAVGTALYVTSPTSVDAPEASRATTTSSYGRCCQSVE